DLLSQRLADLLAPPAVTERDGDRSLGRILTDDVLVQLVHDLGRGHDERHGDSRREGREKKTAAPLRAAVLFYRVRCAPDRPRRITLGDSCAGHGPTKRLAQCPGCDAGAEMAPPRGMHWLGGRVEPCSTLLTRRSKAC